LFFPGGIEAHALPMAAMAGEAGNLALPEPLGCYMPVAPVVH
jgi:hypothetical protein